MWVSPTHGLNSESTKVDMPKRKKADYTYRPYDPAFHVPDLINRMGEGELNVEVAAGWNISISTFNRWRKENPELEEAYEKGLTYYEDWFIKNTFKPMIEGKLEGRHAFNSAIAIANNKLGWRRDSQGGTSNTQININQMTVNNNKTSQELIDSIQKDLNYLVDMNVIDAEIVEVPRLEDANKSNEQD